MPLKKWTMTAIKKSELWTDRLSLAICLWLCTAPFFFFVVAALFDIRVAGTFVAVTFVVILLVCNVICRFQSYEEAKGK